MKDKIEELLLVLGNELKNLLPTGTDGNEKSKLLCDKVRLDLESIADDITAWKQMKKAKTEHPEESELQVLTGGDHLDIAELSKLLDQVPNWDMFNVIVTKVDSTPLEINSKADLNEIFPTLVVSDVKSIIINDEQNEVGCHLTPKSKPWSRDKVLRFLDKAFPKVFENQTAEAKLKEALDGVSSAFIDDHDREYIEGLVTTFPNAVDVASVSDAPFKSSVLVIAGESGSGKTLYATRTLREFFKRKNCSTVYFSLQETDPPLKSSEVDDKGVIVKDAIKSMFDYLDTATHQESNALKLLSVFNFEINKNRNQQVLEKFNNMWESKVNTDTTTKKWWNAEPCFSRTLNGLVIIIDEVGKDIPFAFGLVDVGQVIINDIIKHKKAKKAWCWLGYDLKPIRINNRTKTWNRSEKIQGGIDATSNEG
jgi:hypothetical protein